MSSGAGGAVHQPSSGCGKAAHQLGPPAGRGAAAAPGAVHREAQERDWGSQSAGKEADKASLKIQVTSQCLTNMRNQFIYYLTAVMGGVEEERIYGSMKNLYCCCPKQPG